MKTNGPQNGETQTTAMQHLIELRLKARLREQSLTNAAQVHPDDDLINAFVEGRLEAAESTLLISHLVACADCLHLTSELVRFAPEMDEVSSSSGPADDHNPLRRFLDRIAEGAMPSIEEDAVFAYEEKNPASEKNETAQASDDVDLPNRDDR